MPKIIFDIIFIIAIFLPIIFIIILTFKIISFIIKLIKRNKVTKKLLYIIMIYIIITIISLLFFIEIVVNGANYITRRNDEILLLNKMVDKQKEFYKLNGYFSPSFKKLGYNKRKYLYSHYMKEDTYLAGVEDPKEIPAYIQIEANKIYAVGNLDGDTKLDILYIDYEGNINVILKDYWLAPDPK